MLTRGTSLVEMLQSRNLRLRLIGGGISVLGDQFYLIALPWLVLQLAGTAFAMGTVLALAGVPRALFMLVGGAITDRFSPRTVMLASNVLHAGLVALLAALVLTGLIGLIALLDLNLTMLFVGAGSLIVVVVLAASLSPAVWAVGLDIAEAAEPSGA